MTIVIIILALGANFVLSWFNARNVGKYWSEAKVIKGGFRVYIVIGYIIAIAGFTEVYGYILMLIVYGILNANGTDPQTLAQFVSLLTDLIYVFSAVTIIPAGFLVTGVSLKNAFKERSFPSIATAGWNSYAQIRNTVNAARELPSAIGRIAGTLFKGAVEDDDSDSSPIARFIGAIAVFVLILAILSGYFTASAIMKKADKDYDAFAETETPNFAEGDINVAMPTTVRVEPEEAQDGSRKQKKKKNRD